ncbi:hypothetical protein [Paenibacillus ihumii]|uniref:hypothetical protein n=1 Tax=Paenibacillus ihumii TaxID=687436 RepID=UPI0006D76721|nr:hypothetical protein [Paenibacillus ihumii]
MIESDRVNPVMARPLLRFIMPIFNHFKEREQPFELPAARILEVSGFLFKRRDESISKGALVSS